MITMTGATGPLNGGTLAHLLERVSPTDVTVVIRDLGKAARFRDLGVTVRQGGYDDGDALARAFEGADQVLLVSSSDPGADAVALHRTAIGAAVAAGAGRILYTSHQGAGLDSPFRPAADHAATEQLLAESGVAWTALRNGFYAHSLPWLMGPWAETGTVVVPADGPVSWTAREDAAEAAAIILAANGGLGGGFDGPTTLTAGSAPTFDDVAALASDITGRPITRVLMSEDEWISAQVAEGTPEFMARFTLGIYRAASEGRFAGVDPLLANLLGREPRTVREMLAEHGPR